MTQKLWTAVDAYIADCLVARDAVLDSALAANAEAGLPTIDVTPNQGKLLQMLARMQNASRILEIGALGGYSTIWLARALPADGVLITLEANPVHARVAAANIDHAGLAAMVEVRLGPALETLAAMAEEGVEPFDLIFIDADKPNNPGYLDWAVRFSRMGTLIVVDNVIREGGVIEPDSQDASVRGTRRMFEMLAADRRLDATALQTVGSKGYDGFAMAIVKDV